MNFNIKLQPFWYSLTISSAVFFLPDQLGDRCLFKLKFYLSEYRVFVPTSKKSSFGGTQHMYIPTYLRGTKRPVHQLAIAPFFLCKKVGHCLQETNLDAVFTAQWPGNFQQQ